MHLHIHCMRTRLGLWTFERDLDERQIAGAGIDGEGQLSFALDGPGCRAHCEGRSPTAGLMLAELFWRIDAHEGVQRALGGEEVICLGLDAAVQSAHRVYLGSHTLGMDTWGIGVR